MLRKSTIYTLFTLLYIGLNTYVFGLSNDTTNSTVTRAKEISAFIEQNQRYVTNLTTGNPYSFPVGIKKEIGGKNYIICIDSVSIKPQGAYLTAYMVFPVKTENQTKELIFRGANIPISNNGGIDEVARLELIQNFDVKFGETILRFLADNRLTFVEWDCGGFVQMGIDAEAIFSKEWLLKENPDGSISNEPAKGRFTTVISDWSNLMTTVSIDPFQVKGLNNFSFEVNQASFDFSDVQNPVNILFPSNYSSNLPPGMETLWKGFHLQQLKVKLPSSFSKNSNTRAEIIAQNLIIDKYGFTGIVGANNIFPLNEGNLNGWQYSLDSLRLAIVINQLTAGSFAGKMNLPIMEQNQSLAYAGYITQDDNYGLAIQSLDTIQSTLWKAKLSLTPGSTVDIIYQNGKFKPKATLNGNLSLNLKINETNTTDNAPLKFNGINFQQLVLQTEQPYISVGSASLANNQNQELSKFPITLNNVGISTLGNEIKLDVGVQLNLTGANNNTNGFGAGGNISVVSEFSDDYNVHRIKYKRVDIGAFSVNIDQGSFSLRGSILKFDSEPTYGNGFKGQLQAKFKLGIDSGINVQAQALFGNINGYRYWSADALTTFSSAIPVFPGFDINGFGGGAYYHMKQTNGNHPLGTSISGINYIPDVNTGLGIKAMVGFQGPKKEAYHGDVTLEFAFNTGGGLSNISLYGNAEFMTPPIINSQADLQLKASKITGLGGNFVGNITNNIIDSKLNDFNSKVAAFQSEGKVSARAFIQYDFNNKTLHATFDTYVKLAGGLIRGTGNNYLAGNATMHFAPNIWYIHIGNPTNRVGLRFLNLLNTGSYFMVGNNIPPLPPLPNYVSSLTGNISRASDFPQDMNLGKGFAVGASLNLTSSGGWAAFNYSLNAGLGFDLLIKHTPGILCGNTNSYRGINGWYSEAQTWAYLSGNVGIKVRQKTFNILSLSAAAVLQAKLPNPSWFDGTVAGSYNVLGGLVKGSFNKNVTFGKTCSIQTQNITQDSVDVKIISKIETNNTINPQETSTLSTIKTHLNIEANKEEQMELLINSAVETYTYKINLVDYEVKEKNTSNLIQGITQWDTTGKIATFKPNIMLNPNTEYSVYTKVQFLKKTGSSWQPLVLDGNTITEEFSFDFKTNQGEETILPDNILYSYPIENQTNLYVQEYLQGFIKLNQSQASIFDKDSVLSTNISSTTNQRDLGMTASYSKSQFKVKWKVNDGSVYYSNDLSYNTSLNQVEFSIPQNLPQEKVLHIDFIKILGVDTTSIYDYYVRSSKYQTLSQKLQAYQYGNGWTYPIQNLVHEVGVTANGNELFDKVELKGKSTLNIPSLLVVETKLDTINWYNQYINPLIYQNYPYGAILITNRNITDLGLPPTKSSFVRYTNLYELSKSELKNNQISLNNGNIAFVMNTAKVAANDYSNLHHQIANLYAYNSTQVTPQMLNLLNGSFVPITAPGDYYLNISYRLPNGMITTNYPLKINVPF